MTTRVLPASDPGAVEEAARLIRAGEVVAFPTETVYGLGADALNESAVRKIYAAKGRPGDNPLIVHIADMDALRPLVREIPRGAMELAEAFWPGPLTIIFPKSPAVPDAVTGGLDTVAVRMPSSGAARSVIRESARPLAAPSANASGRPSPTLASHVLEDMDGKIPLILDGGACRVGVESTVVALDGGRPVVLRPGGVTPEMLADVLGGADVDRGVLSPVEPNGAPRSPGMKYRHYAPKCRVRVFRGDPRRAALAIAREYDENEGAWILCSEENVPLYGGRRAISLGSGAEGAAANLFGALREADKRGARLVLAEGFAARGIGLAVMNRLGRAASFDITDV